MVSLHLHGHRRPRRRVPGGGGPALGLDAFPCSARGRSPSRARCRGSSALLVHYHAEDGPRAPPRVPRRGPRRCARTWSRAVGLARQERTEGARWRTRCTTSVKGEGYAVANIDALGDGTGFRKIRRELDVTAFGINAIVIPPGLRDRPPTTTTSRRRPTSSTAARSRSSSATAACIGSGPAGCARVDAATVRAHAQRRRRGRRVLCRRGQGRLRGPRRHARPDEDEPPAAA